jgi:hypothetical protein
MNIKKLITVALLMLTASAFTNVNLAVAQSAPPTNYDFSAYNSGSPVTGTFQDVFNGYNIYSVTGSYSQLSSLLTNASTSPWYLGQCAGCNRNYDPIGIQAYSNTSLGSITAASLGETSGLTTSLQYMAYYRTDTSGHVNFFAGSLAGGGGINLFNGNTTQSVNWAVAGPGGNGVVGALASAPEIDGSLAPKVGFLLGCLFLMFGRKKQNTESLLSA